MSKEKILNATAELIKVGGLDNVTIRKIADRAGTNVASINYHFGSKERLINEVLRMRLEEFRSAFDVLEDIGVPPLERLKRFLMSYSLLLLEHPGLSKRALSQEQLFDSHAQYVDFAENQGFNKLIKTITEITGAVDQENVIPMMIKQMLASICFSIVIAANINPGISIHPYPTSQSIKDNIDLFLNLYFYKFRGKTI